MKFRENKDGHVEVFQDGHWSRPTLETVKGWTEEVRTTYCLANLETLLGVEEEE